MAEQVRIEIIGDDRASGKFKQAGRNLQTTAGGIEKAFGRIVSISAAAIAVRQLTQVINQSIQEFARFELGLTKVGSLIQGDISNTFKEFEGGLSDIATQFGQTTEALNAGLFDIVSAGVETSKALEVLEASALLATGGFTSTDVATSALITTFQTFTEEVKDATDAADFLFAVQEKGRLTVADVATQFGRFAATGKSLGIEIEEIGAAFALISRAGIGAARSATRLEAIFRVFSKITDEQVEALQALGVELDKDGVRRDGLLQTISKLKNLSAEQIFEVFKEQEAVQGLILLLQQEGASREVLAGIVDREGKAQEAASKALETLAVRQSVVSERLAAMQRIIGSKFGPILVKFQEDLLDTFTGGSDLVNSLAESFETLLNTARALLPIFKALGFTFAFLINSFALLLESINLFVNFATKTEARIRLLTIAVKEFFTGADKVSKGLKEKFNKQLEEANTRLEDNQKQIGDLSFALEDLLKNLINYEKEQEEVNDETDKFTDNLKAEEEQLKNTKTAVADLGDEFDSLSDISTRFGDAFSALFERALDRTETFKGAMREFGLTLQRSVFSLLSDFALQLADEFIGLSTVVDSVGNSVRGAFANNSFFKGGGLLGALGKSLGLGSDKKETEEAVNLKRKENLATQQNIARKQEEADQSAHLTNSKFDEAEQTDDTTTALNKLEKAVDDTKKDFDRLNQSKERVEDGFDNLAGKLGGEEAFGGFDVGSILGQGASAGGFGAGGSLFSGIGSLFNPLDGILSGALGGLGASFGGAAGVGQGQTPGSISVGQGQQISDGAEQASEGIEGIEPISSEVQESVDLLVAGLQEAGTSAEASSTTIAESLKAAMATVTKEFIKNQLIQLATSLITLAATTAAGVVAASILAEAWLVPALLASIATFGAAAAVGAGALAAAVSSSQGLSQIGSKSGGSISFGDTGGIENLPKFAEGGLVTGPTVGLIGESGPELVVPLDRLDAGFGGPNNISISVDIAEAKLNNPSDMRRFVDQLSEELTFRINNGVRKSGVTQ